MHRTSTLVHPNIEPEHNYPDINPDALIVIAIIITIMISYITLKG